MTCRALLLVNPGARQGGEGVRELRAALEGHGFALVDDPDAGPERFPELIARHREDVDAVLAGAAAAAIAARGHRRRIDLGLVNDRYFFTTASIGLSVQITEQLSSESKRRWGTLAYAVAAVRVLARAPRFHAEISWEGGTRRSRTLQIVVGNGRYYGQALAVAEDAAIDDARLDLYSLEVRHWWHLLGLLPALRRGSHGEHDRVEAIRGTAFEVRTRTLRDINIDGEVCLRTPATFRVVPGAIEVFAPTDGAG